eukprot:5985858-Alexandrium_andersonii.AAC.1
MFCGSGVLQLSWARCHPHAAVTFSGPAPGLLLSQALPLWTSRSAAHSSTLRGHAMGLSSGRLA